MKTKEEIKSQIERLKTERASLPERSMFGDENWRNNDAQVEVLQRVLDEDLDECDVSVERTTLFDLQDSAEGADMCGSEYSHLGEVINAWDWVEGERIDDLA